MDLLQSVEQLAYDNIEVIVVDNASPDDKPEVIKEQFPWITLVKSEENLGFAGGNNLGIEAAKGVYYLFINNDTIVPEGFIQPLIQTFQDHPEVGMVSPKIKFHWDDRLIQYAGYTPMNHYTIRNNSIGYHQLDDGTYDTPMETHSIHGAAMMIPKVSWMRWGKMPELYFLYYEEHDWAAMVKRAGYKLYYQPKSFILHKESLSTGKFSPLKTYYIARNRLLYARRNFRPMPLVVSILFQIFLSIPKNSIKLLLTATFQHFTAYWRAIWWNFTNFTIK